MQWSTPSTRSRPSARLPSLPSEQVGKVARAPDHGAGLGAMPHRDLSAHTLGACRHALPAPTDLLAVRRRGHCPIWPVGGRLDDTGAALALPPLGHVRT